MDGHRRGTARAGALIALAMLMLTGTAMADDPLAGCYAVIKPLTLLKRNDVSHVRLTTKRAEKYTPGFQVDARLTECPECCRHFCSWEVKDGKVIVGVGTGFIGWDMTLQPTAGGLKGYAEYYEDVPVRPRRHTIELRREPCP